MAKVTRTINPLHFEDLEPHRFEDLVRQLIYDFRQWRRLEATGRSGADDGFDARGTEITAYAEQVDAEESESEQEDNDRSASSDRMWLVQCKREQKIGPTKLASYVRGIQAEEVQGLHGILLAAACDFSKAARDAFRDECKARGIQEWHLWGKAEVEDLLFRPANDHLLFAYFGISLQIRKRSIKTAIGLRLTMKRRALKHLSGYKSILIRDATDDRYPLLDANRKLERLLRGRWLVRQADEIAHDGVHFECRRAPAFLHDDSEQWDLIEPDRPPIQWQDPWREELDPDPPYVTEAKAIWEALSLNNRANFTVYGVLPFDSILAIDELGDDRFSGPHVYTPEWQGIGGPFAYFYAQVVTLGDENHQSRTIFPSDSEDKRVHIFPRRK